MKLGRISKPLRSVQVRVSLTGDLNAELARFASYYQQVHGESVETKALISEILHVFLEADREFQSWLRSSAANGHSNGHARGIAAASSSEPAYRNADSQEREVR